MNFLTHSRLKWMTYVLELFLVFIVQFTPNLLPSFLGVKPVLPAVFALSISMFESENSAMWVGLIAGLLMDLGSSSVFGFNGLFLMILCYITGTLVVYLMRNNIVSALALCTAGIIILELIRWFFTIALWGDPKMWYYIYAVMLPRIVYSAATIPIAFYFNRALVSHMDEDA